MNYKLAIAAIVLPMSFTPLLSKSGSAAELTPTLEANPSSTLIAQRYDPYLQRTLPNDRRNDVYLQDQRENRQEALRRAQLRREEALRNQERRRDAVRRVWIPGHYEPGFLGIGRKWVEGHWEERR